MSSVVARALLLLLLLGGLPACSAESPTAAESPSAAATGAPRTPTGASPSQVAPAEPPSRPNQSSSARRITRLLSKVEVTQKAPYQSGYDRSCDGQDACQFGKEWTDKHPGKFGGNGCTTREDVLLQQMRAIEMRWGSECRIYQAALVDPYTGERLTWRDDGYWIQIDHIYPLAEAWHAGAWAWPQRRRVRFANDVTRELLAVSGRANQDKGSGTLSEWLPPNKPFRCMYVARYLAVASAYSLTITAADAATATAVAARCD